MRKLFTLLLVFGLVAFVSSDLMAQTEPTGFQVLKKNFIDGDWRFMAVVLICLILGLAFCIERIITLNLATTNTDKLLARIDERLVAGDIEGAKEVAKSTPGPTASVLYEGLRQHAGGADAVEKAIVSYGSVQMGLAGTRSCLDLSFHRHCTDARFHGYGNRYDPGFPAD